MFSGTVITLELVLLNVFGLYVNWLDNSPQETKLTQKLTTLGHRTAINNE